MNLSVKPPPFLKGTLRLPASKSYSIRAFLIAACGGSSTIIDPSRCDDARVAANAARALGAVVKKSKTTKVERWQIRAGGGARHFKNISVGESGTVLRFLLPLLGSCGRTVTVVGKGTLRGRPNAHLTRALRTMGLSIKGRGPKESIPITVRPGTFKGGKVIIDGSLSSQFVSALLIACPKLSDDSQIILKGRQLVSTDYVTMTRQVLALSGIRIRPKGSRRFMIKGRQVFKGLKNFHVPSDYGLAAFLMAAAVLTRSDVQLKGYFKGRFVQADQRILGFLRKMGVMVKSTSSEISITGPFRLNGGVFSLKDCPDLVPVMAVLALFAHGRTRLADIGHARAKESDRISDLRKELLKVGAKIKEERHSLTIFPQKHYQSGRTLDPHKDHRLAMAFCVLGTKVPLKVKDVGCTHKSYPDFIRDFRSIGALLRSV